jgi:hypothetical protein
MFFLHLFPSRKSSQKYHCQSDRQRAMARECARYICPPRAREKIAIESPGEVPDKGAAERKQQQIEPDCSVRRVHFIDIRSL